MHVILALVLALTSLTGQPTSQPIAQASAPMMTVEDTFYSLNLWVAYELHRVGQTIPDNTVIVLTNEDNCGAELALALGYPAQGGCTHTLEDGSKYITVSPELAWTAWGTHTLHHELGHVVLGYQANECEVEAYAQQFETVKLWAYPDCAHAH